MNDQNVVISLTQDEWMECVGAMRILIKETTANSNTNKLIADSVSVINQKIFSQQQNEFNTNVTTNTSVKNVTNLTDKEFDGMLNEIQRENDKNASDALESKNDTIIRKQFYSQNDGIGSEKFYGGKEILKLNSQLEAIWQDYVSINSNLIERELKQLLSQWSNKNKTDDVNYLYSKMIRSRRICSLFPFKSPRNKVRFNINGYIELILRLNESNNINLKKYCILYSGICNLLLNTPHDSKDVGNGFGGYLRSKYTRGGYGTEISDKNSGISLQDVCQRYILHQVAELGLLGEKFEKDELLDIETAIKNVKESLFGVFSIATKDKNKKSDFDLLIEYSVQDIKSNDNLKECFDVYKKASSAECRWDVGLVFYIINRLVFAIYRDLMCYDSDNCNVNSKNLVFPGCINFFKLLFNYSIFLHCYPHDRFDMDEYEIFYTKEYYEMKEMVYQFSSSASNVDTYTKFDFSLARFRGGSDRGTLLHICVACNFVFLVKLLLKDGFSSKVLTRAKYMAKSALNVAKQNENFAILALMNSNTDTNGGVMDDKSLESRYSSFMNQYTSTMYLLKILGFENVMQVNETELHKTIKHERFESDGETENYKSDLYTNHYSDDLYRKFDDFVGLLGNGDSSRSISGAIDAVYAFVSGVMSMIEMKLPISDELLIFACVFCNYCANTSSFNTINSSINQLAKQFFTLLDKTIEECLLAGVARATGAETDTKTDTDTNGSNETEQEEDLSIYFKERNYVWFKLYLLKSNIWFVQLSQQEEKHYSDETETKTEKAEKAGKKVNVLFEKGLNVAKKGLIQQKRFIWNHIQHERKTQEKLFDQVCNFGSTAATGATAAATTIRQDKIDKGILPESNELDTLLMSMKMGNAYKDFDISFENNTKIYLTQCLTFAHANNARFQEGMKWYFQHNKNINNSSYIYQSAPVKLYDRCVVKATSDYQNEQFPSVANIVDFLRFSITFNSIESLLIGLNTFVKDISNANKNKHLKDYLIDNGIIRVKNGFSNIKKKWQKMNDAEYCDIKLNIIYKNEDDSARMIIEAQFLLSFLLKAKKIGHKLYALVRQEEFVNNICNQVYTIDNNYKKYKLKINQLINDYETNNVIKQLFWKPNVVLSIINSKIGMDYRGFVHYPLLYSICVQFKDDPNKFKFLLFFVNCLFHLSYVLLNESLIKDENKLLKKYFNWNHLRHGLLAHDWKSPGFYGCQNNRLFEQNNVVGLIMKQSYFDGFSQWIDNGKKDLLDKSMDGIKRGPIYYCVKEAAKANENFKYNYNYLYLLSKYFDKNKDWIKYIIKCKKDIEINEQPLILILNNSDIRNDKKVQFVKVYLDLTQKCNEIVNLQTLEMAIDLCNKCNEKKGFNADNKKLIQKLIQVYIETYYQKK